MTNEMKIQYTVEENGVIWYEQNGVRYSFTATPGNADYEKYLESLNP